jgi:hypothetical protein
VPELTDDHIEDLFADLRTAEMHRVRPPGVAAARTTVRRRRMTTAVAAAIAMVAVAGGIAAAGLSRTAGDQHDLPASALDEQIATATRLVSDGVGSTYTLHTGSIGANRSSSVDLAAVSYTMRIACVGTGSLTVAMEQDNPDVENAPSIFVGRHTVPCTANGHLTELPFTVRDDVVDVPVGNPDLQLFDGYRLSGVVTVTSDSPAMRSSYAYLLTTSDSERQRLADQAKTAMDTVVDFDQPFTAGSSAVEQTVNRDGDESMPAGSFTLHATCAGTGFIEIRVLSVNADGKDRELVRENVPCHTDPTVAPTVAPFSLKQASAVAVEVLPADSSTWTAGYAYAVLKK